MTGISLKGKYIIGIDIHIMTFIESVTLVRKLFNISFWKLFLPIKEPSLKYTTSPTKNSFFEQSLSCKYEILYHLDKFYGSF